MAVAESESFVLFIQQKHERASQFHWDFGLRAFYLLPLSSLSLYYPVSTV